jgi:glycosyltransferase involved in cell wall biosynthesis
MALRLAHFVQRYPPALGGSEAYFARLSRYLADRGEQVSVFTTNAESLEAFWLPGRRCVAAGVQVEHGVEVRRYPMQFRFRGRRWLLKPLSLLPHRGWQALTMTCNPLSWPMWRDCGRLGPRFDAVHATAFPYAFPVLCARRLAQRLGVPFLLTPFLHLGDVTNPRDPTRRVYTSPAMMALAASADLVFAQTPSERDALVAGGVAADRVVLQGLGVDVAECTGGDRVVARRAWGSGGRVAVGHLANNSAEKGTIDLLRAAEILWRRGHDFQLILAGPEMANFRRFWQCFPLQQQVRRLGTLTDARKRDFFAGLDVFVMPSRSDSFGLVLLEAWANGVPNLAYRAGGVADLVRHEADGLLARCGDVEALASHLLRLLQYADLRQQLGRAGQARVATEFRWPDKLAMVHDAIRTLVPARAAGGDTTLAGAVPRPLAAAERRNPPVAPR